MVILVLLIGAVLAAETINTTIENLVDMYTKEYDEKAKIVKDTAAGTVLILAITSAIIGLIIFIPKIINYIFILSKIGVYLIGLYFYEIGIQTNICI